MNSIDLLLDEENELTFQLSVEGTRPAEAKCRLMLENKNMSLVFDAQKFENEEVHVILPPLHHVLKEGTYDMSLEVIVDDRYFEPLSLKGNFEKRIKVTAEAKVTTKKKKIIPKATLLEVSSRSSTPKPVKRTTRKKAIKESSHLKRKNKPINKKEITDNDIMKIIEALASNKK